MTQEHQQVSSPTARLQRGRAEPRVAKTLSDSTASRTPRGSVVPSRREDGAGGSVLSRYFQEMAMHKVLGAEEELKVAKAVEAAEVEVWCVLLSYFPAVLPILEGLEPRLLALAEENRPDMVPVNKLRKMLSRFEKGRSFSEKDAQAWREHAATLGKSLRMPDADRIWMQSAMACARNLYDEQACPPDDREVYKSYLAEIARVDSRQKRVKERFVRANLRLVVSIARRYNRGKLPLIDLIQEGNIGLIKAVERFEHARGYRFSTYASWWIRHAVSRALADKGRTVRIPVHMLDTYNRVNRARQTISARTGREATPEELSQETGIPADKLAKVEDLYADTPFSLDRPVGDEDGRKFIDFLEAENTPSPHECLVSDRWSGEVKRLLSTLSPIESNIIRLRFGLDDQNELTLKEIGDRYSLSRERIRQLQEQAIGKIRRQMRDF